MCVVHLKFKSCFRRSHIWVVLCGGYSMWVVLILPSVSLTLFSQSLMWRIGGWVEVQVFPPPRSPLTSYCCPVRLISAFWNFSLIFDFFLLLIHYFLGAVMESLLFARLLFLLKKWNNFSSHGKIYCLYFPFPPFPLPSHLQCCSLHGLQLARSEACRITKWPSTSKHK